MTEKLLKAVPGQYSYNNNKTNNMYLYCLLLFLALFVPYHLKACLRNYRVAQFCLSVHQSCFPVRAISPTRVDRIHYNFTMMITYSMKVCHAQHLVTNSQGQGHNFDAKSVSHALILGFMFRPYLLQGLAKFIITSHDYC